jgi:hypothetical protein
MDIKKQVSFSKFARIQRNPDSKYCIAYRWPVMALQPEAAITSYVLGDYLYASFRTKKQSGERIVTSVQRYWIGDNKRKDCIAFCVDDFVKF